MPVRLTDMRAKYVLWLIEAIQSVFESSFKTELVIVDDASHLPIEEFLGKHGAGLVRAGDVRIYRFERPIGLIRALNFGLQESHGDFVARLDADDRWLDGSLDRRMAALSETDGMVFGGLVVEKDGSQSRTELRKFDRRAVIRHGAEGVCMIPHCSIIARRAVLQSIGGYEFSPESQFVEDYATWSTLIRFFNINSTGTAEYIYRQHDNSVSSIYNDIQQRNTRIICDRYARMGDGSALEGYLAYRSEKRRESSWKSGIDLASAWAHGGRLPHFGCCDALEEIFYDRVITVEGDEILVSPQIV